jgi:hypothetical protein
MQEVWQTYRVGSPVSIPGYAELHATQGVFVDDFSNVTILWVMSNRLEGKIIIVIWSRDDIKYDGNISDRSCKRPSSIMVVTSRHDTMTRDKPGRRLDRRQSQLSRRVKKGTMQESIYLSAYEAKELSKGK